MARNLIRILLVVVGTFFCNILFLSWQLFRHVDVVYWGPLLGGTRATSKMFTPPFSSRNESSATTIPQRQVRDVVTVAKPHQGQQQPRVKPWRPMTRFPAFGTPAFNQSCRWTLEDNGIAPANCTLLARPDPRQREGVSAWIAQVIAGYVMSKQSGCTFLMDYFPGVNITEIFLPRLVDWRVPRPDYDCRDGNCMISAGIYVRGGTPELRQMGLKVAAVPGYRNAYNGEVNFERQNKCVGLKHTLGADFNIESSMACAFSSLIQLSPTVIKYQPNIFTEILPTLHNPNAFVISIYIRTGQTENLSYRAHLTQFKDRAVTIIDCALGLEDTDSKGRNVVWMVVTDSFELKSWIIESYSSFHNRSRTILTTTSRGAHTKFADKPSTADFVEGMLDWYLIGESDAVVADYYAPSFGNTATFRTARPYYKVSKEKVCIKTEPTYRWE